MADQLQLRGGTTSEILAFTGAQREVVVDTEKRTLVVQDGITAGGYPLASSAQVSSGTFYYNEDSGSASNSYILVPKANTNTPSSYLDGIQFGFVTTKPNTGPSTANFQGLGVRSLKYPGGIDPQAGDISGRVYLIYDAINGWLEIQRKATGAQPQIRTIGASVSGNALTLTLQPCIIDFRSPSLNSGSVVTQTVAAAISLTVPSGATLGTLPGVVNRLAVIAIYNAGTIQLAVTNLSNGIPLDETTKIDVVGISSGSSQANVFYASSSVLGVPYRVMGFVESTQTTPGAWISPPTQIQGQGGQAIIGNNRIVSASPVQTSSGTSVDFSGIPASTKRITMLINHVSTNGTSPLVVQIGTSSGVETSGYSGGYMTTRSGAFPITNTANTGLHLTTDPDDAATQRIGVVTAINFGSSNWILSGNVMKTNTGGTGSSNSLKVLTGTLDRIRLTTANGTDLFDGGYVNILYES
ncbi:hypothetical protein H7A76_30340 [Pseudomonas sp. MSSRFD41]|uniref:hyaluronate lyase N-terminal domain-containing protein n=1 Tax=Pseudomonas sp. MSSRFD41 TaxID=1310370 RepID=UPI001639DA64|nr:hypothetical protein [Pseudomonas sp. MSSRFD41]MBC2659754.1 hypothetical protein [Pseudomonas sp. MSSRFD41]